MVCSVGGFDQQLSYVLHHTPIGMLEPKDVGILVRKRTPGPYRHTTF